MRILVLANLLLIILVIAGCSSESDTYTDQIESPKIQILGKKIDTTFLYGGYKDEGAYVIYDKNGNSRHEPIKGKGSVNTTSLGTYYIDYDFTDPLGNHSATVTRTVYVIESNYAYLNGTYDVVCQCSITTNGSIKTESVASNYTANVLSSSTPNGISINFINVGPEVLQPITSIIGDSIVFTYYSPNLQLVGGNGGFGKLSSNKDQFTIYSIAKPFRNNKTYHCKNTFTKQLNINLPH